MLLFADSDDLERFTGEDWTQEPPANAAALIRRASGMVQHAVRAARFHVGANGLPTDDDVLDALRDATCAQVAFWESSGVDPTKADTDARVTATSLDGASLSYDTATAAQAAKQSTDTLCGESVMILHNAGLIGGHPWLT